MTRAPLPTATSERGQQLTFVTTEPAPTVLPRPIVMPGRIMTPPPIKQSSPMVTGLPSCGPLLPMRRLGSVGSVAVYMLTLGPMWQLSPILTSHVSMMVQHRPITTLCPMEML
ncbi:hypothetical protein LY76DRAFT_518655 [Colletotrichum caudatum]|nr:hypothetical protein LY76DRAFT_518655 [Colletotrichum caudatum]